MSCQFFTFAGNWSIQHMQLIDTHSHIYLEPFNEDIEEVIQRAKDSGLEKIILPNIDSTTLQPMHAISNRFPDMCIPLAGLHPTHVKDNFKDELLAVFNELDDYPYIGIGEIGIDLYWDKTYLEQQKEAFEYQLLIAKKKKLPIVIHARDSFREILDIVKKVEYKGLTGIFHAFTGDIELAQEITDLGYLLGIGGILTFKNSHLPDVISKTEIKHIVIETDSPYLAPVPFRGKRNESSYVKYVAERLAEIKGMTLAEVALHTTNNAKRLFNL